LIRIVKHIAHLYIASHKAENQCDDSYNGKSVHKVIVFVFLPLGIRDLCDLCLDEVRRGIVEEVLGDNVSSKVEEMIRLIVKKVLNLILLTSIGQTETIDEFREGSVEGQDVVSLIDRRSDVNRDQEVRGIIQRDAGLILA
jgi:hypothetical protein